MNLATLVSSLVLAASTATAGLLVAPLHATPQDGSGGGIQVGPLCFGVCGNETGNQTYPGGNQTFPLPLPFGNSSQPPADGNQTAPPPSGNGTADAKTCGVDIEDSRDVEGPTDLAWSWMVGTGTQNLTVDLEASGLWMPFGGGVHVLLTDGDGNTVAHAEGGGSGVPFDYTVISYQGDRSTGLSSGLWHLTVEADGIYGGVSLQVHSAC